MLFDIESIARQICIDKSIDPDQETTGLGAVMPRDEKYKLWEYQLPFVQRVMDLYDAGRTTSNGGPERVSFTTTIIGDSCTFESDDEPVEHDSGC